MVIFVAERPCSVEFIARSGLAYLGSFSVEYRKVGRYSAFRPVQTLTQFIHHSKYSSSVTNLHVASRETGITLIKRRGLVGLIDWSSRNEHRTAYPAGCRVWQLIEKSIDFRFTGVAGPARVIIPCGTTLPGWIRPLSDYLE